MGESMPVSMSILMSHAPLIIPKIAKSQAHCCSNTTKAMEQLAQYVLNQNPDQIIVISPHTPRLPNKFGLVNQRISGNLSSFGFAHLKVRLPWDQSLVQEISLNASKYFEKLPKIEIDHGAIIPLWFLQQRGWEGKTNIIGFPAQKPYLGVHHAVQSLRKVLDHDPQNFVLIASGDLSHNLSDHSPMPFHPDGSRFDKQICHIIKSGSLKDILSLDQVAKNAEEDCIESLEVMAFAHDKPTMGAKILSYEAPFGVGYCVAVLNQHTS